MLNSLIFIVLPYAALVMLVFVTPYRFYTNRLTWSAYSTQFLEQKTLYWGQSPGITASFLSCLPIWPELSAPMAWSGCSAISRR